MFDFSIIFAGNNSRRLNQKKPAAIKLRHLAKATSPPGLAFKHLLASPSVSSTPLVISISLSMLRHQPRRQQQQLQKTRRVVALSSFVMKKRASSRLSSTSSDASYHSDSPAVVVPRNKKTRLSSRRDHSGKPAPSKEKMVQKSRADQGAAVSRACHSVVEDLFPSRRDSATCGDEDSFPMDTSESYLQRKGTEGVGRESVLGANCNSNNRTHAGTIAGNSSSAVNLHIQEDDQISISSSSTNSMSNGSKGSARNSSRRRNSAKSARNFSENTGTKATFSFDELFSFYPPKLVVRNGELELEHTMSVKNADRWHLPANHPLLRWTPGQPVRGMAVMKTKKKKGGSY